MVRETCRRPSRVSPNKGVCRHRTPHVDTPKCHEAAETHTERPVFRFHGGSACEEAPGGSRPVACCLAQTGQSRAIDVGAGGRATARRVRVTGNPVKQALNAAHTVKTNGGGGIRTPETLSRLTVFKTVAFSRSATPPCVGDKMGNLGPEGRNRLAGPRRRVRVRHASVTVFRRRTGVKIARVGAI